MADRDWKFSPFLILPPAVMVIPLLMLAYESYRSSRSFGQLLAISSPASRERADELAVEGQAMHFLKPTPIGAVPAEQAAVSHVSICDLDQDGLNDVLVCDLGREQVSWIRQFPKDVYHETQIGNDVAGPAHAEACDLDQDGDLDVLVAVMGGLFPDNRPVGKIVVLENDGQQQFVNHVLAENVSRVTDVQCGDLDGDADLDLVVGQFGYDQGQIQWMENRGDWKFVSHKLLELSGTIHTPLVDLDADGDLDIVALVSQEWEEVYAFENHGGGRFTARLLYGVADSGFGSSGIALGDLDGDGDMDLVWSNGDAFVTREYVPIPNQGLQWLENLGQMRVRYHRMGRFQGAYSPCVADLDGDGDKDVLAVSGFNDWRKPGAQSMRWWRNDGHGKFTSHDLAAAPTHLVTADTGDMNGDGKIDVVTGCMVVETPFDRAGRITLWINRWNRNHRP